MKTIYKILGILFGLTVVGVAFFFSTCNACRAQEQSLPEVQLVPSPPQDFRAPPSLPQQGPEPILVENKTKRIEVDLSKQVLTYFEGDKEIGSFPISSGIASLPTPIGTFHVQKKIPVKLYQGVGYYLPNTKWNLEFLPGYFIHGAYWHHNFGHPMSHGCVNVSYDNMEGLYNWADVGTQIIIHG